MAPFPRLSASSTCSMPSLDMCGVDVLGRVPAEPERLHPVARVGVERPLHLAIASARSSSVPPCTRCRWRAIMRRRSRMVRASVFPSTRGASLTRRRREAPRATAPAAAVRVVRDCARARRSGARVGPPPPRGRHAGTVGPGRTPAAPLAGARGTGHRAASCASGSPAGRPCGGADACRQTLTKRWTAVIRVSTSMTHSTGTSRTLKARPMARTMMRSARSIRPPRASRPNDSALARW